MSINIKLKCKRCGHEWIPQDTDLAQLSLDHLIAEDTEKKHIWNELTSKIRVCSKCKSAWWCTDRKQ